MARREGLDAWLMVGVIVALVILSYIDRAILSLLGDMVRRDLGISDKQLSVLFGLGFILPLALATLAVGWAIDRWNRVWILLAGLLTWSTMTALCGLAEGFVGLLIARGGMGIGESVVGPAGYALVGDRFPAETRGKAIGIIAASVSVGAGLAFIVGGLVLGWIGPADRNLPFIGIIHNWQFAFVLLGAVALPLAPLVMTLRDIRPLRRPKDQVKKGGFARHLRNRARIITTVILCGVINVAAGTGMVAWMPLHLSRAFGVETAQAGIWLGAMSVIGGVLGAPGAAALSDRFMRERRRGLRLRTYPACFVLTAIGAALIAFAPAAPVAVAGFLLVATMLAAINAVGYVAIQEVCANDFRGRILSIMQFATLAVGYGIGPSLTTLGSALFGESPLALGYGMLLTAAPLAMLGAGLALIARDSYRVAD